MSFFIGARLYAEKINNTRGPIKLVIPLRGWSSLDHEGSILYDPAEDRLFFDELKRNLKRPIDIEEVDCNLEELNSAQSLVNSIDKFMREDKT